jgi:hypothetical protein
VREEPKYIYTQTRRPKGSDPGQIEEGWYTTRRSTSGGTEVLLTTRDGIPLAGRLNRRELTEGQTPAECARLMLRNKISDRGSDFNRRLSNSSYSKIYY